MTPRATYLDPQVYPTNHMFASYHTDLPRKAVIGSVLLITAIATLFALYDWVSKRHTRDLYIQNAIANSQFSVAREAMRSRHAFVSMVSVRPPAPSPCCPVPLRPPPAELG